MSDTRQGAGDALRAFDLRCRALAARDEWRQLRDEARLFEKEASAAGDQFAASHAWMYVAAASRRLGDLPGTIAAWEQRLKTAPDPGAPELSPAHGNLALALLDADLVDEALPHFERALQLEPTTDGRRQVLANQAAAFERLGELRRAAEIRRNRAQELADAGRPR